MHFNALSLDYIINYQIFATKRETESLIQAANALNCDKLTLVALTDTREVIINGRTIHIRHVVEWLLSNE